MKKAGKIAKSALIAILVVSLLLIAAIPAIWCGALDKYYAVPNDLEYVQDYNPETSTVKNGISSDLYKKLTTSEKYAKKYELGVNANGDVVFKKPRSAFNAVKKEYKSGWKYVDKTLKVKHLSKTYYLKYIELASTIDQDKNATAQEKEDLKTVAAVLTIYERSYYAKR